MDDSHHDSLQIQIARPENLLDVLRFLFSWETDPARLHRIHDYLVAAKSDRTLFDLLVEARRNGQLVGAAWAHVLAGRVANVWPAVTKPGEPATTANEVQVFLENLLAEKDVDCSQSLLPLQLTESAQLLSEHGYVRVAELLFLAWSGAEKFQEAATTELEFETYCEDQQARLAELIEATYVNSLDAPALNGVRNTRDVIDGYRRTGIFDPGRWYFVRYQHRDVGCLLLTEHVGSQWELVYMGLVPEARGRSWGIQVTRFAQDVARRAKCQSLLLGVDAANGPAIAMYSRCGFLEVEKRLVMLKRLRTP